MAFDLNGALAAGASHAQIAEFLAQHHNFDLDGARAAGADDEQIASFLSEYRAAPTERTWGESATDKAALFGMGAGGALTSAAEGIRAADGAVPFAGPLGVLAAPLVNRAKRALGIRDVELQAADTLSELGKETTQYWEGEQSDWRKAKTAAGQARVQQAAEEGGQIASGWQAAKEAWGDPERLIQQIPNLAIMAALGRMGGGTTGAIGGGAVLQGGDVASGTREALSRLSMAEFRENSAEFQRLVQGGMSEEDARARVIDEKSQQAFGASAALSVAANTLIPGGAALEKVLAGQALGVSSLKELGIAVLKAGAGESFSEGVEEGGGQALSNVAVRGVDPTQSITEGVGAATGEGAATGLVLGGGSNTASGVAGMAAARDVDATTGTDFTDEGIDAAALNALSGIAPATVSDMAQRQALKDQADQAQADLSAAQTAADAVSAFAAATTATSEALNLGTLETERTIQQRQAVTEQQAAVEQQAADPLDAELLALEQEAAALDLPAMAEGLDVQQRGTGTVEVRGEKARDFVQAVAPDAPVSVRADGSLLVSARFGPQVMQAAADAKTPTAFQGAQGQAQGAVQADAQPVRKGSFGPIFTERKDGSGTTTDTARFAVADDTARRNADLGESITAPTAPMLMSNGKPFASEKLAASSAKQRKLDMHPVPVEGGWGLVPAHSVQQPHRGYTAPASEPPQIDRALSVLMKNTGGNGSPDALSGPENARARTEIVAALTGQSVGEIEALPNARLRTSVQEVERMLYDAAGVPAGRLKGRRSAFLDWLDERTGLPAPAGINVESAEIGRSEAEDDAFAVPRAGGNQGPRFSRRMAHGNQDRLARLAQLAREPGNENDTVVLGPVSQQQAALLREEGVDLVDGFRHTADMFAVRHAMNRHSNASVEASRGQLPLTDADIRAIEDVVLSPDAFALGAKTPRGQDVVGSIKRQPDGTILYIEEVRSGRKTLAMTSMRKYPGTSDFETIANSLLPTNARSDTGDVRIVYPGGGEGQAPRFSRRRADDQYRDTERAYGGRAGYERAKAAGRTKLNYRQWVQVRTPAFKAWFGDWEAASNARPVRFASTFAEAASEAKKFIGKPLTNAATNLVATVSNGNLGKMASSSASLKSTSAKDHAMAIANVDKLFEHAILDYSHPDKRGEPTIAAVHRFVAPMIAPDGRMVAVKMTVKETTGPKEPNPLYSIESLDTEKPALDAPDTGIERGIGLGRQPPQAGFNTKVQALLDSVNPASVSKVTDPDTGEPLVVYHGTNVDFSIFRPGEGMYGKGVYLAIDPEYADGFADAEGGNVMPLFAMITGNGDGRLLWDKRGGIFLAARPEQVKSATGNTGAFGPEENDIRFSFAGPRAETADRLALASAQQRIDAGEDAEAVRQDTGWHRGADGKWRFEINDADAWYDPDALVEMLEKAKDEGRAFDPIADQLPLDHVLDHPALFAAYPALSDVGVVFVPRDWYGLRGSPAAYSPRFNTIVLADDRSVEETLSSLLHEVQHSIQYVEGFATGSSPHAGPDVTEHNQMLRDGAVLTRMLASQGSIDAARELFVRRMGREPTLGAEGLALSGETADAMLGRVQPTAQERYHRSAGEVEARNTQTRQQMTDAERRATPPSATADVADSDVIVTFNGKEAHSAPPPANARPQGGVVASLTGTELGEFGDDVRALRKAAISWYQQNLQHGEPARHPTLGEVRFTKKGRDEVERFSADPDKLKLVPALREIVEGGAYVRTEPLDHPRTDKIVAFHVIEADVTLGGNSMRVQVEIGEDTTGNLFYDIFSNATEHDAKKKARGVPGQQNPGARAFGGDVSASLSASIPDDGLNIKIIGRDDVAPVVTRDTLRESIAERLPSLAGAVDRMLARGDEGKRGGMVLIESASAEAIAQAYASKTGRSIEDARRALDDEGDGAIDTQRSDNGDIQGFFDPQSGITFLVAPNLTAEAAPAVLLHEATHGRQRAEIDARALALIEARSKAVEPVREFLDRVADRMDAAGETGNAAEATAYIVEEAVLAGRQEGFSAVDGKLMDWVARKFGKRVADIVRDFVAMVRGFGLKIGVPLNPSVDDLVAIAKSNVRAMARGEADGQAGESRSAMKDIDANIRRGLDALAKAVTERTSVHRAMFRNGLGWVDFVWGSEGTAKPSGKTKGAMGLAHILEARQRKDGMSTEAAHRLLGGLVETIARGQEIRRREIDGATRAVVAHSGKEAVLARMAGSNTWLVSGWEVNPGASKAANDTLTATHPSADSSDARVGAGSGSNVPSTANNDKPRFSRSGNASAAPAASKPQAVFSAPVFPDGAIKQRMDQKQYEFQDRFIDLKKIQQSIVESGRTIRDEFNPYMAETLMHGKAAYRVQNFLEREIEPMLALMRKGQISIDDLNQYLHARHAEERNAAMAARNPNEAELKSLIRGAADAVATAEAEAAAAPDSGKAKAELQRAEAKLSALKASKPWSGTEADRQRLSGMSNAEARAILDKAHGGMKATAYRKLGEAIDRITAQTRDEMAGYGLESSATVAAMDAAYQHYVPLHRDMDQSDLLDSMGGTGRGFSVRGSQVKQATGSLREVENIFANIVAQREATIVRGEKNRVAKALYGLVMEHPNSDMYTVIRPGMSESKLRTDLAAMGLDPATVDSMAKAPTTSAVNARTGLVEHQVNPQYARLENAVVLRVNGEDRVILFNKESDRAVRLVRALRNDDSDYHGFSKMVMDRFGPVTRYLSAINTQYNPVFGLKNFVRDVQGAALNLESTQLAGKQVELMKSIPGALKAVSSAVRGDGKHKWAPLYEEFLADGGATGFRDQYASMEARAKAIERDLGQTGFRNAKGAKQVLDALSDYNTIIENATRFAAYKLARDAGLSRAQAADLAKDITVNFNRKGARTGVAAALYAFFNASVQGAERTFRVLNSPRGRKIIAGGLALGVMQAVVGILAMGDDWDEIPEHIRSRNLIIPAPWTNKKYIAIPMPLGWNAIPNMSRSIVEMAYYQDRLGDRALDLLSTTIDAFNPLGSTHLLSAISPSAVDPLVEMGRNENFAGRSIEREDFSSLAPTPGWTRAKEDTGAIFKGLSYAINWVTSGGKEYEVGMVSPTPEMLSYAFGVATGGVGREIDRAVGFVELVARGDEIPAHKVPVLGGFYGEAGGNSALRSKYYSAIKAINEAEFAKKKTREAGGDWGEYGDVASLGMSSRRIQNRISDLNKDRRLESDRTARAELDAEILSLQQQLVERYRQVLDEK